MVLKYIKSIWQSNSTSQVKTNLTTFISTTAEQLQDCKTGDDHYKQWSKKIEALHYYYEQDIDYILERKISFDDIFTSKDGQHPPILKMFLSKRINFETVIILDDILSFSKRLNKNIKETVLWPKLYDRMIRYKPFLIYNVTKYKKTLKLKLKEI